MKIKDFIIELRCIKNDLDDVRSQVEAILREIDMVLGDYDDPTNVDTDPPDEYDDGMDGDHASALASAGWGTDEDYGG